MSDIMKFENLQDRIIELRSQSVLLDARAGLAKLDSDISGEAAL